MLNRLLKKIREDKGLSKLKFATYSNFDPGYIAHMENGERIPSHTALKRFCSVLDVPYQQLMYCYDKELSDEHMKEEYLNIVPYNYVVAIDSFDNLIRCPATFGGASFSVRVCDNSMEPKFPQGSYAFIEQNTPLESKDVGLFYANGEFLIRRFSFNAYYYILKPDNSKFETVKISKKDKDFYVIGKVLGTNDDF